MLAISQLAVAKYSYFHYASYTAKMHSYTCMCNVQLYSCIAMHHIAYPSKHAQIGKYWEQPKSLLPVITFNQHFSIIITKSVIEVGQQRASNTPVGCHQCCPQHSELMGHPSELYVQYININIVTAQWLERIEIVIVTSHYHKLQQSILQQYNNIAIAITYLASYIYIAYTKPYTFSAYGYSSQLQLNCSHHSTVAIAIIISNIQSYGQQLYIHSYVAIAIYTDLYNLLQ